MREDARADEERDAKRENGRGDPVPESDRFAAADAELVREICDAVVAEVEPERVVRAALAPLARGLNAAPVSLYLVDPDTGELQMEGEWDGGLQSDRRVLAVTGGLTGTVFQNGHLVAAPEPQADPRFDASIDTAADGVARPLLCVPMKLRGKTVGLFRAFPEDRLRASARTGEMIAAALSAAVRSVLLYRSLVATIEEVALARRDAQTR
jgi:sigma-B regulation protein RsbU (phosphoserine phosphatase)